MSSVLRRGTYKSRFRYEYEHNGKPVNSKKALAYIKKLNVPTAYNNVQINLDETAKVCAIGHDSRGRAQYIYNQQWTKQQRLYKFCWLHRFADKLPMIRTNLRKSLRGGRCKTKLKKDTVVAAVLQTIMDCGFRMGNQRYLRDNNSHGITTLHRSHTKKISGGRHRIKFKGKSGVCNQCDVHDNDVNRVIRRLVTEQKGTSKSSSLWAYYNAETGESQAVTHLDVNQFLKTYGDGITAKMFRTWIANTRFIQELSGLSGGAIKTDGQIKKVLSSAVKNVAQQLRHTPSVCRKNYICQELADVFNADPNVFRKVRNPETFLTSFLKKNKYCKLYQKRQ